MAAGSIIGIWIGAALTLVIFSFIYRDNPFFKVGEHVFLGIALGYGWCIYYWNDIFPQAIAPTFYPQMGELRNFWVLIPNILGLFIILRLVPKLAWLSRISFALYIGGFAGIAVPNVISGVFLPQLTATMGPLTGRVWPIVLSVVLLILLFAALAYAVHRGRWWKWVLSALLALAVAICVHYGVIDIANVNQLVLLIGVFCTVVFFFFSLEHKGTVGAISRVGVVFIMVAFGASFGYTVMARVSLLIGRFQFLLYDWIQQVLLRHAS